MVVWLDQSALIAHLPRAVSHLPQGDRSVGVEELYDTRPRLTELLTAVVRQATEFDATVHAPAAWTIPHLGRQLLDLAEVDVARFEGRLEAAWAGYVSVAIGVIERSMGAAADLLPALTQKLVDLRDCYLNGIASQHCAVPMELRDSGLEPEEALETFRRYLRLYGETLAHWPRVVDAANALRADSK